MAAHLAAELSGGPSVGQTPGAAAKSRGTGPLPVSVLQHKASARGAAPGHISDRSRRPAPHPSVRANQQSLCSTHINILTRPYRDWSKRNQQLATRRQVISGGQERSIGVNIQQRFNMTRRRQKSTGPVSTVSRGSAGASRDRWEFPGENRQLKTCYENARQESAAPLQQHDVCTYSARPRHTADCIPATLQSVMHKSRPPRSRRRRATSDDGTTPAHCPASPE